MTATEWIAEFAAKLGIDPPDQATVEELLALAGDAAHASERVAAPIAPATDRVGVIAAPARQVEIRHRKQPLVLQAVYSPNL